MTNYVSVAPIIHDSKESKFRVATNTDVIHSQNIDDYVRSMQVVTKILRDLLPGEVPGTKNTPYSDYPYRNSITHNVTTNLSSSTQRVNNLVTGSVETLGGKWYLGTFVDTKYPDAGEYPVYFYEVDKPAEGTIAVDYFRTVERRNGAIEYHYEGTTYRTSTNDKIRFTNDYPFIYNGYFYTFADPKEPKPTDVVKHTLYHIVRKLVSSEVPQKVITSPVNRTISGEDSYTASATSRIYLG